MRKELRQREGERSVFTGRFERFGAKHNTYTGRDEITVLLRDVTEVATGNRVADHLWFNLTKGFEKLNLEPGDRVQFCARVARYQAGYRGWRNTDAMIDNPPREDFKLSHPTKVVRVSDLPR